MFRDQTGQIPAEYYNIAEGHPDLKGSLVGEIIDEAGSPLLHLRTSEKGRQFIQPGKGDIVIPDISKGGWCEIRRIVGALGPDATMADVKRALAESPIITWDGPLTGK